MLDSDTANLWQGVGEWEGTFGAPTSVAVDQSEGDDFGSLKVVASAAGHAIGYDATNRLPVAAATPLSFAYMVQVPVTGDYLFRAREWNAVDVVQNNHDDTIGLTAGVWYQYTKSYTTRADAVTVDFQIRDINSLISATEITRIKNVVVRQDASTTFLPSVRVIGDIEIETDISTKWATGANQTIAGSAGGDGGGAGQYITGGALRAIFLTGAGAGYPAMDVHGLADDVRATFKWTRVVSSGLSTAYIDDVSTGTSTDLAGEPVLYAGDDFVIGEASGLANIDGEVYSVALRDGIGGPVVAMMNPQDAYDDYGGGAPGDSSSWTGSVGGRTWTANGAGVSLFNATPIAPDNLNAIKVLLASDLDTELLGYLVEAGATSVTDVTGALNELNSTTGIGFREAYYTFITAQGGTPAAG